MSLTKSLIVCVLLMISAHWNAFSQACNIEVKTEVIPSAINQGNGSVSFFIDGQSGSKDFSIFNITVIAKSGEAKSAYRFTDLEAGIYEFVIVDRKKAKCSKEVQIKIEQK